MSISINVGTNKNLQKVTALIEAEPGSIWRQYSSGIAEDTYYIVPARNERIILIWRDSPQEEWELATDDYEELKQLHSHVKIMKVNMELRVTLFEGE